jgi:hypothetical protein
VKSSTKIGTAAPANGNIDLDERIKLEVRLLSRQRKGSRSTPIPRRGGSGPCALSFAQSRLWLVEQISPVPGKYNISRCYRIRGALNPEALRAAQEVAAKAAAVAAEAAKKAVEACVPGCDGKWAKLTIECQDKAANADQFHACAK